MNNNSILMAMTNVYERLKCQQFASDKIMNELSDAIGQYSGPIDKELTTKWLTCISNITQDAILLQQEKDKEHFAFVHDFMCNCLSSYINNVTA